MAPRSIHASVLAERRAILHAEHAEERRAMAEVRRELRSGALHLRAPCKAAGCAPTVPACTASVSRWPSTAQEAAAT
eukprot:5550177-Prymnesium_polylepis.1